MRTSLLHVSRFACLLIVAILAVPAPVHAQPKKNEAVEAFQRALDQDLDSLPEEAKATTPADKALRKEILDKREKTLGELEAKITSLLELSEVLRSPFSNKHQTIIKSDKRLNEIDTDIFKKLSDKFVAEVNKIRAEKDVPRLCAVAILIGDTISRNIEPDSLRNMIVNKLLAVLDTLADSNDPDIQSAVARAIGEIVLELRDSLGREARDAIRAMISKIQKAKLTEPRRAVIEAAAALVRVFNSRPGEESDSPSIPFRADLVALVPLTPILFVGCEDADHEIRLRSLEVLYRLNSLLNSNRKVFIPVAPPGRPQLDLKMPELTDSYVKKTEVIQKALLDPSEAIRLSALQSIEELAQMNAYVREEVLLIKETKTSEHADTFLEPFLARITPNIVTNLTHANYHVRLAATQVLESRGNQARQAAVSLVPRMEDENLFVRWASVRALGRLNNPTIKGAVAGLAKLLNDNDLSVRMAAAVAIESLGSEGRDASEELLKLINSGDADFREVAIRALGVVGPYANTAPLIPEKRAQLIVPAIAKELSNPDKRVRIVAAQALTHFGKAAARFAGKELKEALNDEEAEVRLYATEALLLTK